MDDRRRGKGEGERRGWRSENGEEPRILLNIQPDTLADWLLIIRPTRITINLAVSRVCSPQTPSPPRSFSSLARIDRGSTKRGKGPCVRVVNQTRLARKFAAARANSSFDHRSVTGGVRERFPAPFLPGEIEREGEGEGEEKRGPR